MADDIKRQRLLHSMADAGVPERLRGGLAAYVLEGRPTGGFLRACLENNFVDAVCRADGEMTIDDVRATAKWIYNDAPGRCWGSPGVVKTWRGE